MIHEENVGALYEKIVNASYRLFSGVVCFACACAFSARAKTVIGVAVNANPATATRLVTKVQIACAMVAPW